MKQLKVPQRLPRRLRMGNSGRDGDYSVVVLEINIYILRGWIIPIKPWIIYNSEELKQP